MSVIPQPNAPHVSIGRYYLHGPIVSAGTGIVVNVHTCICLRVYLFNACTVYVSM